MITMNSTQAGLVTRVKIQTDQKEAFAAWQSRFHAAIASFKGFISLEIASISQTEWCLRQNFESQEALERWQNSEIRDNLLKTLDPLLNRDAPKPIFEELFSDKLNGVTEVFVTKVSPNEMEAYRQWIGKIHAAEVKFPGFQRVYVQSPRSDKNETWITLLQFDTVEHLDQWLLSKERQKILEESNSMVKSLESHRVTSSFAGWFGNLPLPPAVWKQTMLVLLVLFPVVMLEMKYLVPWTKSLNFSLGTFIGNAISVSLVSWPLMPLAIFFLKWWLRPSIPKKQVFLGVLIVLVLYLIEITIFWYF